jgi:hypothetical protein
MQFRIQLKQGSRTYVERGEFKTQQSVIDFYNTLTTCRVSEIWGGATTYKDDLTPPIDDMNYYRLVKFFVRNDESKKSMQVVLRNVKLTKNMEDIAVAVKAHMEIDGLPIDSIANVLFKRGKED